MAGKLNLMFFLLLSFSIPVNAQNKSWTLDIKSGIPVHIPAGLTIHQNNYPEIRLKSARFNSEPFRSPYFWSARLGYQHGSVIWELEEIHLKLFLKNKPEEVQQFSISHGYNLLFINRSFELNDLILIHAGMGIALTHPETTIRSEKFNENNGIFNMGYYLSGAAIQLSLEKRIRINRHFFFCPEIKVMQSRSSIPVANGRANFWNANVQFLTGLLYQGNLKDKQN